MSGANLAGRNVTMCYNAPVHPPRTTFLARCTGLTGAAAAKKGSGMGDADRGSKHARFSHDMPGQKKLPKGNKSYPDRRYDGRYDDFPEVRALSPSLLTERREHREALEGEIHLWACK